MHQRSDALAISGNAFEQGEPASTRRLDTRSRVASVVVLLALGACTAPTNQIDKSTGFIAELPESVALIAAPYQNLREVTLKPEDGCYWYRHVGPVETTMLPLRTSEGRPICTGAVVKSAQAG
jgi:hypothetical protein